MRSCLRPVNGGSTSVIMTCRVPFCFRGARFVHGGDVITSRVLRPAAGLAGPLLVDCDKLAEDRGRARPGRFLRMAIVGCWPVVAPVESPVQVPISCANFAAERLDAGYIIITSGPCLSAKDRARGWKNRLEAERGSATSRPVRVLLRLVLMTWIRCVRPSDATGWHSPEAREDWVTGLPQGYPVGVLRRTVASSGTVGEPLLEGAVLVGSGGCGARVGRTRWARSTSTSEVARVGTTASGSEIVRLTLP